jgi:hypothetical protein
LIAILLGCAEPLPEEKTLWKSNQTPLLITQSGKLEYESQKGALSASVCNFVFGLLKNIFQ